MKIAVYGICKNEKQFVRRFLESVKDADGIFISDTGSTDETVEEFETVAKELNIFDKVHINTIHVSPWRFDVARNANMAMIPSDYDYCLCLDLDEVIVGDLRKAVEDYSSPTSTRVRYMYVWSHKEDGSHGTFFWYDKLHKRKGFRWDMPVHETLYFDAREGSEEGRQTYCPEEVFSVHHWPDATKSRSQYLPLLELSVKEQPYNDRQSHYYARELYFYQRYEEAIEEFKRHLSLERATWNAERAASYRYIGDCYWKLGQYESALTFFEDATKEDSNSRECWVSLAQAYRAFGRHKDTMKACKSALKITKREMSYISDPVAWSDWPNKMLEEAESKYKKHFNSINTDIN